MIASAPGKLILAGEYAVLDGASALVVAVDRRAVARRRRGPCGSSPFLVALAETLAQRFGADDPAARAALEIVVDSSRMFEGTQKLGLGSSAAVTVAATALALAGDRETVPVIDRELVAQIAYAVHARCQRGGSGADIAAAVHGGTLSISTSSAAQLSKMDNVPRVERLQWPAGVRMIPFFTGASADTPSLIAKVAAARAANPVAVNAALTSIADIAKAACRACATRATEVAATALLSALALAARATDQLATATGIPLVPPAVLQVRAAVAPLGGTAKTTGAGGGDVAIAVIPATEDAAIARRSIIESGCLPLELAVDQTGVDLHPDVQ